MGSSGGLQGQWVGAMLFQPVTDLQRAAVAQSAERPGQQCVSLAAITQSGEVGALTESDLLPRVYLLGIPERVAQDLPSHSITINEMLF